MKKWANKSRGLRLYGEGKDVYGMNWHLQDGSWAEFHGLRIYGHNSDNEHSKICLSLKIADAKKLIKALQKAVEPRPKERG